jgi:peptidyl-tRNA hydrolase
MSEGVTAEALLLLRLLRFGLRLNSRHKPFHGSLIAATGGVIKVRNRFAARIQNQRCRRRAFIDRLQQLSLRVDRRNPSSQAVRRFAGVPSAHVEAATFTVHSFQDKTSDVFQFFDGWQPAGATEVGVTEAGATEAGATEVGATEVGVTEVGVTEAGATEVGASEVGVTEVGVTEAGATEVGASEVGANTLGVGSKPLAVIFDGFFSEFPGSFCSSNLGFVLVLHVQHDHLLAILASARSRTG